MNALFRQYFRRRKNRRNRRNYIFFGSNLSQNITVSIYVTLLQFFYPRANDTFGTPFGGWFGSTWSISAGRGWLKSCYGVKLCLMLVENAVLCQRNYDGFLCYFFYLIITISFQVNIQSFVDFQRRILRVSVCFTFFFGLSWSVSKARFIFILKWEGYSHSPVFFPGNILTCQPGFLEAWFCLISRSNITDPQTCSVQAELRNLWVCFY